MYASVDVFIWSNMAVIKICLEVYYKPHVDSALVSL